jgi:hypothetical protein
MAGCQIRMRTFYSHSLSHFVSNLRVYYVEQVSDDEGGEEEQQTETPRGAKVPVREKLSLCDTAQSYLFTQSGTILLDGLVGIGKDGLDDSLARTSSARAFKLPVDKRLVLLCRLGHGASSVVYKV